MGRVVYLLCDASATDVSMFVLGCCQVGFCCRGVGCAWTVSCCGPKIRACFTCSTATASLLNRPNEKVPTKNCKQRVSGVLYVGGESQYRSSVFCFLPGETPNLYDNYKASDRIAPKLTLVGGETYNNVVLE